MRARKPKLITVRLHEDEITAVVRAAGNADPVMFAEGGEEHLIEALDRGLDRMVEAKHAAARRRRDVA